MRGGGSREGENALARRETAFIRHGMPGLKPTAACRQQFGTPSANANDMAHPTRRDSLERRKHRARGFSGSHHIDSSGGLYYRNEIGLRQRLLKQPAGVGALKGGLKDRSKIQAEA